MSELIKLVRCHDAVCLRSFVRGCMVLGRRRSMSGTAFNKPWPVEKVTCPGELRLQLALHHALDGPRPERWVIAAVRQVPHRVVLRSRVRVQTSRLRVHSI